MTLKSSFPPEESTDSFANINPSFRLLPKVSYASLNQSLMCMFIITFMNVVKEPNKLDYKQSKKGHARETYFINFSQQ